jgi:hypothetical protein
MTNLNEVLEFIKNSNQSDLKAIMNATSIRKSEVANDVKSALRVGDTVKINHKKIAASRIFSVTKINGVNVKVKEINGTGNFTVAPSLLEKA